MNKYYAKFDNGERETSIVEGIHFTNDEELQEYLNQGFVTISEQEQALYCTGEYVQDEDGKPVKRPAYVPTLEELKPAKLLLLDTWTATAITSGFTSGATGTTATYDSTEADQQNIMLMLQAAQTADFATHPIYKGKIPIRAVPEGQTSKVVLQHSDAQMQQLVIDMALHIGACKQKGWQLQEAVAAAETTEEIDAIKWPE